jgi:hypothetical protein
MVVDFCFLFLGGGELILETLAEKMSHKRIGDESEVVITFIS